MRGSGGSDPSRQAVRITLLVHKFDTKDTQEFGFRENLVLALFRC